MTGLLTPRDREFIAQQVVYDIQGGLMPMAGTSGMLFQCEGSSKGIGVHPVQNTPGPRPVAMQLYRIQDFFMRIGYITNSAAIPVSQKADTMYGAYLPGGVVQTIPLSPAATTIFACATVDTNVLRVSWVLGA